MKEATEAVAFKAGAVLKHTSLYEECWMAAEIFSGNVTVGNPSSPGIVSFVATCPSAYTSH